MPGGPRSARPPAAEGPSQEKTGGLVDVGRITGVHGIAGEIKVESLTDFPERFNPGSCLLLELPDGGRGKTTIQTSRVHKGRFLLTLDGIADRTAAESLRGGVLKIAEEEIKKLPAGEYYRFQLQGLTVVTDEDRELGQIVEIMATGSNLVLVVRGEGGEILLPYIDDVVLAVDIEAGRMTVHLLEGLLPEA